MPRSRWCEQPAAFTGFCKGPRIRWPLPTGFDRAPGRRQVWVFGGGRPPTRIEGRLEGWHALERCTKPPRRGHDRSITPR